MVGTYLALTADGSTIPGNIGTGLASPQQGCYGFGAGIPGSGACFEVILSHSQRFVFLKAMKIAGSSLELALYPHLDLGDVVVPMQRARASYDAIGFDATACWIADGDQKKRLNNHVPLVQLLPMLEPVVLDYRVFGVERNPWDRAVSHFFWLHEDVRGSAPAEQRQAFQQWIANGRLRTSFPTVALKGRCGADILLRYEHLAEDLAWLSAELGFDAAIDIHSKREKSDIRPQSAADYRRFYDEDTAHLVSEAAAPEIELMGYTFDGGVRANPYQDPDARARRLEAYRAFEARGKLRPEPGLSLFAAEQRRQATEGGRAAG